MEPIVVVGVAALLIVILILVAVAIFVSVTYNSLVKARNNVWNSFAQIDVQLQRRFDLLPNLVETVKRYATHEKKIIENVAAARSGYLSAQDAKDKIAVNKQLSSTLKSLFVVSEHYPDLKANQNFMQLQKELAETENKVTFARQFYNDAVTMYNSKLQMFPGNIVARMFGFAEEDLFNMADDDVRSAPILFDSNELTDEEKERYPQKCPHCLGTLDGTRNCPYCGARVV